MSLPQAQRGSLVRAREMLKLMIKQRVVNMGREKSSGLPDIFRGTSWRRTRCRALGFRWTWTSWGEHTQPSGRACRTSRSCPKTRKSSVFFLVFWPQKLVRARIDNGVRITTRLRLNSFKINRWRFLNRIRNVDPSVFTWNLDISFWSTGQPWWSMSWIRLLAPLCA